VGQIRVKLRRVYHNWLSNRKNFIGWEEEIVTLGPTSADHLILIPQVKQGYVNRRNAT